MKAISHAIQAAWQDRFAPPEMPPAHRWGRMILTWLHLAQPASLMAQPLTVGAKGWDAPAAFEQAPLGVSTMGQLMADGRGAEWPVVMPVSAAQLTEVSRPVPHQIVVSLGVEQPIQSPEEGTEACHRTLLWAPGEPTQDRKAVGPRSPRKPLESLQPMGLAMQSGRLAFCKYRKPPGEATSSTRPIGDD